MSGAAGRWITGAALTVALAGPAAAHGLLVSIHGEGAYITGHVYYSNGMLGADQYTELTDLSMPGSKPVTGKTDAGGYFRFAGVPGHRYRFLTEGEEAHTTEMQITLAPGAKARFIDRDAQSRGSQAPPAWAVVAGVLTVLTVPALIARRRKQGSQAQRPKASAT